MVVFACNSYICSDAICLFGDGKIIIFVALICLPFLIKLTLLSSSIDRQRALVDAW